MIHMNVLFFDRKNQKTRKTSYEQYQQEYVTEYKQIDCFFEMDDMSDKLFEVGLYIDFFIIQIENHDKNSGND